MRWFRAFIYFFFSLDKTKDSEFLRFNLKSFRINLILK